MAKRFLAAQVHFRPQKPSRADRKAFDERRRDRLGAQQKPGDALGAAKRGRALVQRNDSVLSSADVAHNVGFESYVHIPEPRRQVVATRAALPFAPRPSQAFAHPELLVQRSHAASLLQVTITRNKE